ncbi:MAG: hypothetical protein M9927_23080, partial [Anaerolineae bacterium]|nr:hypothetical protein [Anaerolineae bacterium]
RGLHVVAGRFDRPAVLHDDATSVNNATSLDHARRIVERSGYQVEGPAGLGCAGSVAPEGLASRSQPEYNCTNLGIAPAG